MFFHPILSVKNRTQAKFNSVMNDFLNTYTNSLLEVTYSILKDNCNVLFDLNFSDYSILVRDLLNDRKDNFLHDSK